MVNHNQDALPADRQVVLAIDIGGSWIKYGRITANQKSHLSDRFSEIETNQGKIKNSLHEQSTVEDLVDLIHQVIDALHDKNTTIVSIGIATTGIVNYHGDRVLKARPELTVLSSQDLTRLLESTFQCPVILINDADAAAIGLAEMGYLEGNKTVGIMPIGTGLGFTVWRNGRRWRPFKSLTLLGSIISQTETYNSLASASTLAGEDRHHDLAEIFRQQHHEETRTKYLKNLAKIICSAATLYHLDEVILCGGLVNAASSAGFLLDSELNALVETTPSDLAKELRIRWAQEGNLLQIAGALSLAENSYFAALNIPAQPYQKIDTENQYDKTMRLEKMSAAQVIQTLWNAEAEAAQSLSASLPLIAAVAERTVQQVSKGGRIIYLGSGSSGRIAALDAVEIPCTFGFPEERIITLVSGGLADAAIEIEANFEEDASSLPEMLLLHLSENDVVIGISASGSSKYVQSGLAYAKTRGALSILIQASDPGYSLPFCDFLIPMHSGHEVLAGSTRMKAGTATKKILNFFSTTVMVLLGKVTGTYMTDLSCLNNKLVFRARHILQELYGMDETRAGQALAEANMNLRNAITALES